MADTKISALPASTTPLAGTEVLPIVQGGVTKQVSVANLTAGRAISATEVTLTTGNLIVASGQGVDFSASAHSAGMTSELLDDYEEGTWTPTQLSGLTLVGTFSSLGVYTKIGRQVTAIAYLNGSTSVAANAGGAICAGLPFTASGAPVGSMGSDAFNQGGTCVAYLNNIWACTSTTAATGVTVTITYTV